MSPTPQALERSHAKRCIVRAIVALDASSGPHLSAPVMEIARHVRVAAKCNLSRALQAVVRLQDDPAFVADRTTERLGISLLDRDCVPDARTRAHVARLVRRTIQRKHSTAQYFIPSRARFRFILETRVRPNQPDKLDWYLSYESRVGKPIRSFVELERDLA